MVLLVDVVVAEDELHGSASRMASIDCFPVVAFCKDEHFPLLEDELEKVVWQRIEGLVVAEPPVVPAWALACLGAVVF